MSFSLFPRSVKFYDLFLDQNRKLVKAATILNTLAQDFTDIEEKVKQINIIESDGNKISRNIAKQLSLTFITPIDREDIHALNLAQEDILNFIKAIATRVGLYDFAAVRYPAKRLVNNLRLMVEEAGVMIRRLSERKDFTEQIERVKALKYECEMLLLVAVGENFDCTECTYGAILGVVKWSHVYDRIEQAVNRAESLTDVLEGILLKHA
jgi:uncharacterized protein Yka (UPF0111/DUF47 family)